MFATLKLEFPGSIRSGEKARKRLTPALAPRASKRGSRSSSVVPGYVVDSRTTSWPGLNRAATSPAAATTKEMSGSLDFRSGVCTQMITTSLRSSTEKSDVATYRPSPRSASRSSSDTSGLDGRPSLSAATRSGSVSSPATVNPTRANSTARGRPTYPWPITVRSPVRFRMSFASSRSLTPTPPRPAPRERRRARSSSPPRVNGGQHMGQRVALQRQRREHPDRAHGHRAQGPARPHPSRAPSPRLAPGQRALFQTADGALHEVRIDPPRSLRMTDEEAVAADHVDHPRDTPRVRGDPAHGALREQAGVRRARNAEAAPDVRPRLPRPEGPDPAALAHPLLELPELV